MDELLEKLEEMARSFEVIAGKANEDTIKQLLVAEMSSEGVKYEDLADVEKEVIDIGIRKIAGIPDIHERILRSRAAIAYNFFLALIKEGFTSEQALAITAAQPIKLEV